MRSLLTVWVKELQFQLSLLINSTFEEETTDQKTNQKKDRHRDTETWLSVDSKNRSKGLKTVTLDWSRWNQLSATTAAWVPIQFFFSFITGAHLTEASKMAVMMSNPLMMAILLLACCAAAVVEAQTTAPAPAPSIDPNEGNATSIGWYKAHGWLLWMAFGVFFPVGILLSRYGQYRLKWWFEMHIAFQVGKSQAKQNNTLRTWGFY